MKCRRVTATKAAGGTSMEAVDVGDRGAGDDRISLRDKDRLNENPATAP